VSATDGTVGGPTCAACGGADRLAYRATASWGVVLCGTCQDILSPDFGNLRAAVRLRLAARALADRLDALTRLAVLCGKRSACSPPPWAAELAALREALGDEA